MAELIRSQGEHVETIYQLLGSKENDITCAIAWTLKECPTFLVAFIKRFHKDDFDSSNITIFYQRSDQAGIENGYTDLEITDSKSFHIILEAKRGWLLPGCGQLNKYAKRDTFNDNSKGNAKKKYIVTVSECSQEYANAYLPFKETNNGIPVSHISWKDLKTLADKARVEANHKQKHLLEDFAKYLGGVMTMQDKNSNRVYVVSVGREMIEGTSLQWTDIVERGHYSCPVGNSWPKVPPNYIAFRYDGKLKAIHHIDNYTVTKNIHEIIDDFPDRVESKDHFVFTLGPAIVPNKEIRTGRGIPRSTRVWVDIDLLLTCDTITEAKEKTRERQNNIEN